MTRRLNVLALSPIAPTAVTYGTGLRVHYLLKHLAGSCRTSLVYWASGRDADVPGLETLPIETIQCDPPQARTRKLGTRLADKVRIGAPYPPLDAFATAVHQQAAAGAFDVVLAFHPITLQVAVTQTTLPVIADLIDEPALGAWRDFRASRGPVTRFRRGRHVLQLVRYLRAVIPRAFASLVVSTADARSLRRLVPRVRVEVVPIGVDTAHFQPSGRTPDPDAVVFVGNFDGEPNRVGALFFASHILGRLKELRPSVRFFLVGANPGPEIRALAGQANVEVVGRVEDVRPWLERGIFVSPLISGGGIKTKVLEAWAMARPVVATPLGCAGLPAIHGTNILIAGEPGAFAKHTAELLGNPAMGAHLGREGRETVCRDFSWPTQAGKIAELLAEAAAHNRT